MGGIYKTQKKIYIQFVIIIIDYVCCKNTMLNQWHLFNYFEYTLIISVKFKELTSELTVFECLIVSVSVVIN